MNRVTSFHVIVGNVLLVGEGFSSINQTDHRHVDTFLFLKRLLDLQNRVSRLKVERLLHSGEGLSQENISGSATLCTFSKLDRSLSTIPQSLDHLNTKNLLHNSKNCLP